MSTISQTPNVSKIRNSNVQYLNILIAAAFIITLVIIFNIVTVVPTAQPADHSVYMLYRQGEWVSVPLSKQVAYQIFRQGEVASPVSNSEAYQTFRKGEVVSVPNLTNAEAYHLFRLGEWASVSIPAVDLSAYRFSERTLTDPNAGLTIFLQSERTLTDPRAGTEAYFNSERTSISVPFTQYQLSEWFGE